MATLTSPHPSARSVVEQISDRLLAMVVSGELEAGRVLPINDLAAELGVSHIPVREALRRLEPHGLIDYQRGKGARVAPVSAQDLKDVFRARAVIEVDVGRRSAAMLTGRHLQLAEVAMGDLRHALRDGRSAAVSPAHRALHYALLPAASKWDLRILEQLWAATERYIQLYLASAHVAPRTIKQMVEAHEQLLEAARTGKATRHGRALAEHINESEQRIRPGVEDRVEAQASTGRDRGSRQPMNRGIGSTTEH